MHCAATMPILIWEDRGGADEHALRLDAAVKHAVTFDAVKLIVAPFMPLNFSSLIMHADHVFIEKESHIGFAMITWNSTLGTSRVDAASAGTSVIS